MKNIFSKISKEDKRVVKIVIIMFLGYNILNFLLGIIMSTILFYNINASNPNYNIPKDFDRENSVKGNFLEFLLKN